jgi:hypothetical protein
MGAAVSLEDFWPLIRAADFLELVERSTFRDGERVR